MANAENILSMRGLRGLCRIGHMPETREQVIEDSVDLMLDSVVFAASWGADPEKILAEVLRRFQKAIQ